MNFSQVTASLFLRILWTGLTAAVWAVPLPGLAQSTAVTGSTAGPVTPGPSTDITAAVPGTDPVTPAAQTPVATASSTSPSQPSQRPVVRDTRPRWSELNASQRQALKPLADVWTNLSELHKRKWLVLSQNFAELSPQEQDKLQERMSDWANLTTRERAQARLHFAEVRQLPNDERRAKWEAYQALSDEQRRKLADDILLQPPRGAAVASRPVAASKLTQLPSSKPEQVLQPRIDTDQINPKTLLPHFLQGTSTR